MADERSVSDVFQDILRNLQEMVRSEIRLAKVETRGEVKQAVSSGVWIAAGGVAATSAWIFLLWTLAYALATRMSMWAATLLVAVVMPDTSAGDAERLVWSPAEEPIHTRTFTKNGRQQTEQLTDLEQWFMSFADARNTIIHQGLVPPLVSNAANANYAGHFVFTAEYLLRAVVKVSLAQFGYPDLWRSPSWRAVKAACAELEARAGGGPLDTPAA